MNDQQRIAELEKKLAELEPTSPELVKVNGKAQSVVARKTIRATYKGSKWRYVFNGIPSKDVPVIEVKDK